MTYGICYGIFWVVETARKITILLPEGLLNKAQRATGEGITPTIRRGLELVAAGRTYENLIKRRGKVPFSLRISDLKRDRS